MRRFNCRLTFAAAFLAPDPRRPFLTRRLLQFLIAADGIAVAGGDNVLVLLVDSRLCPLISHGVISHFIGHVLAVQLGFIKTQSGLQHAVGQHFV
ncbi:hypothetical protein D3C86_1784620 [compost metagenome]